MPALNLFQLMRIYWVNFCILGKSDFRLDPCSHENRNSPTWPKRISVRPNHLWGLKSHQNWKEGYRSLVPLSLCLISYRLPRATPRGWGGTWTPPGQLANKAPLGLHSGPWHVGGSDTGAVTVGPWVPTQWRQLWFRAARGRGLVALLGRRSSKHGSL